MNTITITKMDNRYNKNIREVVYKDFKELYDNELSTPTKCKEKNEAPALLFGNHIMELNGKVDDWGNPKKSRKATTCTVLALDADSPNPDFLDRCQIGYMFAWYTSASATPDNARYRVIFPLSRPINEEEKFVLANFIMALICGSTRNGKEFDWTANQFNRIFYAPTVTPENSYFDSGLYIPDGSFLDVDWFLFVAGRRESFVNGFSEHIKKIKTTKKSISNKRKDEPSAEFDAVLYAGDPCKKDSPIGSFCRVFSIEDAIEYFDLPYVKENSGKYRYEPSRSPAGTVIDKSGNYLFSSHETDPASGSVRNTYDLVRIHKFGDQSLNDSMHSMYKLMMQIPEVAEIERRRAAAYKDKHKR